MKKSLLALAALTAFAGAASAQSSVTLFGVVDLNLRNQDNSGSPGPIRSLSTDGNASSRLGFRGVEDLGGGLRAGFWLEGALSADNGSALASSSTTTCKAPVAPSTIPTCTTTTSTSGAQTWQRRATASLLGAFGEIRLGRDYTPTFWNHTVFDPFGTNGVGSHLNMMTQQGTSSVMGSGAGTLVRANNTVGYFLPAIGGLYGQVQGALAEGPANGNKYFGGRVGYAVGPVNAAVSYGVTETPIVTDLKEFNIGGSYNLGFLTLWAQFIKSDWTNATSTDLTQTNYLVGVTVPVGPGTIKFTYNGVKQDLSATTDTKATQIAVGYVYDLSKRTSIYVHGAKISNDPGAKFVTSGSGGAFASTGQDSTGYELGLRHSF